MNEFFSPQQVATKLGLHKETILRHIRDGKLKAYKINTRTYRISPDQLKHFLEQDTQSPNDSTEHIATAT